MEKPQECVDINVNGLLNVLNVARQHKVKKVVHSAVRRGLWGRSDGAEAGDDAAGSISPYGITKLDGEYYLENVPPRIRRAHRFVALFQRLRAAPGSEVAVCRGGADLHQRALRNQEIKIFGDGEQTRDFIFVKDVVGANVHAATTEAMSGTYNVGRGGKMTVNELAQAIIGHTRSTSTINHLPDRPGDIRHSMADVSRLTSTGWQPRFALEDGLHSTVDFFTKQFAAR